MAKRFVKNEQSLHERALRYLERFPCTVARMRQYLKKLTREAVKAEEIEPGEGEPWVESVIARLTRVGLLDDAAYARGRAGALHRKGKSARAIQFDLRRKGVDAELIEAALDSRSENDVNPELEAAAALARRRRLGPYASAEKRRDARQKHLASLARNGFSFDIARRVIDADTVEDLLEMLS